MRYAFVFDIHANLQAWNAILEDINTMSCERIICLGDSLADGPKPKELVESLRANVHHFVLGRQEAVLAARVSTDLVDESTQERLQWMNEQINEDTLLFFQAMPFDFLGDNFHCASASIDKPETFSHISSVEESQLSFNSSDEKLLFVGHGDQAHYFSKNLASGDIQQLESADFSIQDDSQYLIKVGSAGDPLDGEIQASYVIYDDEQNTVIFQKVSFDIQAYSEDLATIQSSYYPDFLKTYDEQKDGADSDVQRKKATAVTSSLMNTILNVQSTKAPVPTETQELQTPEEEDKSEVRLLLSRSNSEPAAETAPELKEPTVKFKASGRKTGRHAAPRQEKPEPKPKKSLVPILAVLAVLVSVGVIALILNSNKPAPGAKNEPKKEIKEVQAKTLDAPTQANDEKESLVKKATLSTASIPDLILHYDFDSPVDWKIEDKSGLDYHGEAHQKGASVDGKFGKAFQFTKSRIKIPAAVFDHIDKQMTMAFWVYDGDASFNDQVLVYGEKSNKGIHFYQLGLWKKMFFKAAGEEFAVDVENQFLDQWNHWAFVRDNTKGEVRVYRNAVKLAEKAGFWSALEKPDLFILGSRTSSSNYFSGIMDDFRIYKKALEEKDLEKLILGQ